MSTPSAHIGIDPGLTGAIAVLNAAGELLALCDTPTQTTTTGRREINAAALADLLRQWPGVPAAVERVGARPGESATSGFSFGFSQGSILACLAVLGHPVRLVQPASWKRWAGIPPGAPKDASIGTASRLIPSASPHLTLKKHDGRADALLIGLYGLRHP